VWQLAAAAAAEVDAVVQDRLSSTFLGDWRRARNDAACRALQGRILERFAGDRTRRDAAVAAQPVEG
jgi:hypothetical protein